MSNALCRNLIIFLSLRFYVKSKLANVEFKNLPFNTLGGLRILIFMHFCTIRRLIFTKLTKIIASKMAKTAVLELLDSPKLISRKIWIKENFWNLHTVRSNNPINQDFCEGNFWWHRIKYCISCCNGIIITDNNVVNVKATCVAIANRRWSK